MFARREEEKEKVFKSQIVKIFIEASEINAFLSSFLAAEFLSPFFS